MTHPVIDFLETRRSVKPQMLGAPGPASRELDRILAVGARVPDHKMLVPWRFIVFEGAGRERAGEIFAAACAAEEREPPSPVRLDMERQRFLRAPVVIGVVSKVSDKPGAPEWEQVLSAGAASFNMCLAANALGYQTCWITEWIAYSAHVRAALGLGDAERIAGFVYIGTAAERQAERNRPDMAEIVTRWE